MPPRTPIEFFNDGMRRSGRAPPTQSTRCSRDVGFVEPGHAIRRSLKAPKRPPTPAAPLQDEAPPSYDASVYASSVLKSADFKLPPAEAEDELPPSARASFDASQFALPPRPATAASAKASFDAAAYADAAYAAARAPPAASFDDAEPAEAPAAAASFDGAELPVEASLNDYELPPSAQASVDLDAADYELPPSARASVEASLDAAASASASFDAAAFALPPAGPSALTKIECVQIWQTVLFVRHVCAFAPGSVPAPPSAEPLFMNWSMSRNATIEVASLKSDSPEM